MVIGFLIAFAPSRDNDGGAVIGYAIGIALLVGGSLATYVGLTMHRRRRRLEASAAKLLADGALSSDTDEREAALTEVSLQHPFLSLARPHVCGLMLMLPVSACPLRLRA